MLARQTSNFFFRIKSLHIEAFQCPFCNYHGPFKSINPPTGRRIHAQCPRCGSLERHRLQFVALQKLEEDRDLSKMRIIHFAPEPFIQNWLETRAGAYQTADLERNDIEYRVDLQNLPFSSDSYDMVFASYVLEHIPDDFKALAEIRRILTSRGVAVLPVPVVCDKTIEYPEPNPHEANHVRAPGADYYKRYTEYFSRIKVITSSDAGDRYQTWVYEDRTKLPSSLMPYRPGMPGSRHLDYVPICYA